MFTQHTSFVKNEASLKEGAAAFSKFSHNNLNESLNFNSNIIISTSIIA